MATATQTRTAEYKGRKYRLLFLGETKFGKRARLQFFDGSKDFWVAANLVSEQKSAAKESYGRCRNCGATDYAGDDWCMSCGKAMC